MLQYSRLFVVRIFLFFDRHILQFAGFENLSALLAFHVFGFLVAGDDLYLRVLALLGTDLLLGGLRRLARRHKLRTVQLLRNADFTGFALFSCGTLDDVKCPLTALS
jgi:hypothetical protein